MTDRESAKWSIKPEPSVPLVMPEKLSASGPGLFPPWLEMAIQRLERDLATARAERDEMVRMLRGVFEREGWGDWMVDKEGRHLVGFTHGEEQAIREAIAKAEE